MTVCIAAICNTKRNQPALGPLVIGFTDRMLTADGGITEYEPPRPKIVKLTNSIVALTAGNLTAQTDLCRDTSKQLCEIESPDDRRTEVRAVAEKFAANVIRMRTKDAERTYLAPLGLSIETFTSAQRTMATEAVSHLIQNLTCFGGTGTETIIAGSDDTGPHLYFIDELGKIACNDDIGFATAGSGAWHANSEFHAAGFSPDNWEVTSTLLLGYIAKKRSEATAGVGKRTDMFVIGTSNNELWVGEYPQLYDLLEKEFQTIRGDFFKSLEGAQSRLRKHLEGIAEEAAKAAAANMGASVVE